MSRATIACASRRILLVATAVVASWTAVAAAARIPGGADATTDCFAEFEILGTAAHPPGEDVQVACTDCDPTCDKDGVASPNGSCTFEAALCLNQAAPGCAPAPLGKVRARARQLVVPPLDSSTCGPFTSITLQARPEGLRPTSRRVKATAVSSTLPRRVDRSRVKLLCLPRPAGESCPVDVREPCADSQPLRNAYFGDLHIHTRHSFDAQAFDVPTTPQDAYAFARGAAVALTPLAPDGTPTQVVQIDRPLDFAAVTDHSEFLGEVEMCITPGSAAYDSAFCTQYRTDTPSNATTIFGVQLTPVSPARNTQICGPDRTGCIPDATAVWRRIQLAADAAYDRTAACGFTSFVGYEYTAATGISTLHRNVIFRNERVPFPTTYFEQPTARGLWAELRNTCLDAGTGCDALVIPHNSNESNGKMFQALYPGATTLAEEQAQAAERAAMEPLLEIYQHKGDSECRNGLSGLLGAPDELCDFEKEQYVSYADCGDGTGSLGAARLGCVSRRDFARGALLEGLKEAERLGVNPFQTGFIGSTDTHNGTAGFVGEDTFVGHRGTDDDTPAKRLGRGTLTAGGISFSPGGLAGVWAEENSRDALFQALRRREVFATSGPRIAPRFFGGWNLDPGLCANPNMVADAYAQGVAMGGTLPAAPPTTAPSFLVSALRDPGTVARPGTQLQRIQIVKGWRENDESHHQVYEVAGDALNGATVDTDTCLPSGPGFDSLCAVWTDPDFDPAEHAYYYARVVENPTCRWSAYECNRLAPAERPASCTDPAWPKTVQERAWTSPIWFTPSG
jgi:hypothetical protein